MQNKPTPTEGQNSTKLEAESALRDAGCCASSLLRERLKIMAKTRYGCREVRRFRGFDPLSPPLGSDNAPLSVLELAQSPSRWKDLMWSLKRLSEYLASLEAPLQPLNSAHHSRLRNNTEPQKK